MNYIIRVWLTSILIAPFFIFCTLIITDDSVWLDSGTVLYLLPLMICTGAILSIPIIALFYILKIILRKYTDNSKLIKLALSIYSVIAIYITFLIVDHSVIFNIDNNLTWPVVYSLIMIASIYYFRLRTSKPSNPSLT